MQDRLKNPRFLTLLLLLALLAGFNASVAGKEALLKSGKTMLLKLAPVDPRSLMQGDYMILRFDEARALAAALNGEPAQGGKLRRTRGVAVMRRDAAGVWNFDRLDDGRLAGPEEHRLLFHLRDGEAVIAGNSFFFEEGYGHIFDRAAYAELRVADDGTALLTDLLDSNMEYLYIRAEVRKR